MDALEALRKRRSIRSFNSKEIPEKLIKEIIDCARFAPTARNIQPWEFIAIKDKAVLKEIGSLAENGPFIKDCAFCIAVFCKDTKYYLEDGCAATMNILTAAYDLGLAGCWVAGDKKPYCDKIKTLLKVPADFKLVSLIALGYADQKEENPPKRALNELLHWDKF